MSIAPQSLSKLYVQAGRSDALLDHDGGDISFSSPTGRCLQLPSGRRHRDGIHTCASKLLSFSTSVQSIGEPRLLDKGRVFIGSYALPA